MPALIQKSPGTLDAAVANNFPKINELRIPVTTITAGILTSLTIGVAADTVVTLIGTAFNFTDSAGNDLGTKTQTVTTAGQKLYFIPSGSFQISIDNKFNLKTLGTIVTPSASLFTAVTANTQAFHLTAKLGLDTIGYITSLTTINVYNKHVLGSIDVLTKLVNLQYLLITSNAASEVDNSDTLYGNISALTSLVNLISAQFYNVTGIEGDLSAFKTLTKLTQLRLKYCQKITGTLAGLNINDAFAQLQLLYMPKITGDFSALRSLTTASSFNALDLLDTSIAGSVEDLFNVKLGLQQGYNGLKLIGDLAKMNDACYYLTNRPTTLVLSTAYTQSAMTYSAKNNTRQYILGGAQLRLATAADTDRFLIDMASLSANPATTTNTFAKSIGIIGTRTSASDAAVASLVSKGFTVTVSAT